MESGQVERASERDLRCESNRQLRPVSFSLLVVWSVGTYPTEPSSTCSARDGGGRRQKQRVCRPVELQGTASQVD